MRTFMTMALGISLIGCYAPSNSGTSSSSSPNTSSITTSTVVAQTTTTTSTSSATTTSVQKYVYALIGGKVNNFPIDSTTGDLISRSSGGILNSVSQSIPNFQSMILDSSGNYLYALASTGYIWIYSIASNYAYVQYSSSNALTYVDSSQGITYGNGLAWGNNGHLFLRSNTGNVYVYEYTQDPSTGLLTDVSPYPLMLASTAQTTYNINWSTNVTSVVDGTHTYVLDTQTNSILNYQNGVIENSVNGYNSGTFQTLLLK